jgi:hypothetical protein
MGLIGYFSLFDCIFHRVDEGEPMSLGCLWQSQVKKEEARHLISEICGWFTEGLETAGFKEAKAQLEELF